MIICKIHELKKAFSRFNSLQKFKGYLATNDEYLYLCSIDDSMSYGFKIELDEGEEHSYVLSHENICSMSEYFKTVRVRRNCRIIFANNSMKIEIEEKDGEFTPSFDMMVSKTSLEDSKMIAEMFLNNTKGSLMNVNDFVFFTKMCTLRKKDEYFPASQYINLESKNDSLTLCYGYDESIVRCKIDCKNKKVSRETFDYDYIKLLHDLFKDTLSNRASILCEDGKLSIISDMFTAVGLAVGNKFIDLDTLVEKAGCPKDEMKEFPKQLVEDLKTLNKNGKMSYAKSVLNLHGKNTKINKCTIEHPLDKFMVYFNESNFADYKILSSTFDNLPDGHYYKADKIHKYTKNYDDFSVGFGKAGIMHLSKGNIDLLLLIQTI